MEENLMSDERVSEIEFTLKLRHLRFAIECLMRVMEGNSDKNFVFSPPSIFEALYIIYYFCNTFQEQSLCQVLFSDEITLLDLKNYITRKQHEKRKEIYYPEYENCFHDVRCWMQHEVQPFFQPDLVIQLFHGPIMKIDLSSNFERNMIIVNKFLNEAVEKLKSICYPVQLFKVKQQEREPNEPKIETAFNFIVTTIVSCKFSKSWNSQDDKPSTSNRNRIINYYDENLSIHVTDIPYQNDDISLFIISPASLIEGEWQIKDNICNNDLLDLTARLYIGRFRGDLRLLLRNSRMNLDRRYTNDTVVPDFEIEKDLNMEELWTLLNLDPLIFDLNATGNQATVNVRYAVHRCRVKATMMELVVSATTVVHSVEGCVLESKKVDVNNEKPFIWLIYDTKEDEVLFVGSCNSAEPNCHIKPQSLDQPGPSGNRPPKKKHDSESFEKNPKKRKEN